METLTLTPPYSLRMMDSRRGVFDETLDEFLLRARDGEVASAELLTKLLDGLIVVLGEDGGVERGGGDVLFETFFLLLGDIFQLLLHIFLDNDGGRGLRCGLL